MSLSSLRFRAYEPSKPQEAGKPMNLAFVAPSSSLRA